MKSHWMIGATGWAGTLAMAIFVGVVAAAQAAGPGVMGRVLGVDEGGKLLGTVPGAKIELKGGGTTTSDATGRYKIDVPPGTYPYRLTAAGYKDEDSGRGVQLQLSEGYAVFNFTLTKGKTDPKKRPKEQPEFKSGRLKGRVYEKTPKGDVGIGGAVISLRRQGGQGLTRVVTRGADRKGAGNYEVRLAEGEWRASVTARGYEQFVDPKAIRIPVGGEAVRDFVLRREKPPGEMGLDVVVMDAAARKMIRGAEVTVRLGDRPLSEALRGQTGPDGEVGLKLPGDGEYTALARAEGYTPGGKKFTFASGKPSRVEILLQRKGAAEPTVTEQPPTRTQPVPPVRPAEPMPPQDLGEGILTVQVIERGGGPIAGARVNVMMGGGRAQTGATDRMGVWRAKVRPGSYAVKALKEGYGSGGAELEMGSRDGNVRIQLARIEAMEPPRGLTLAVQVLERGGGPIPGASVIAMGGKSRAASGQTDRSGWWRGQVAGRTTYQVKASKQGFSTGGAVVNVGTSDAMQRVTLMRLRQPESQSPVIPGFDFPKKSPTRKTPTPEQLRPKKITPMVITPLQPQTIKRTKKDEKIE